MQNFYPIHPESNKKLNSKLLTHLYALFLFLNLLSNLILTSIPLFLGRKLIGSFFIQSSGDSFFSKGFHYFVALHIGMNTIF